MAYWANLRTVNRKSSFTLLESLVAIYVLVSGVFGMLTLASNSIALSSIFRDQLRAVNLAQEGIELVRNKRDSNVQLGDIACNFTPDPNYPNCAAISENGVDPSGWGLTEAEPVIPAGIGGGPQCSTGSGCRILWRDLTDMQARRLIFEKCTGACPPLYFNANNGVYAYWNPSTGVIDTPFTRTIHVNEVNRSTGQKELEVTSHVEWRTRFNADKDVIVVTYLSPWL